MVLPHPIQYEVLKHLFKNMDADDVHDRVLSIVTYSALIGQISEKNLWTLLDSTDAVPESEADMGMSMLVFYSSTGIMNLVDEGMGFAKRIVALAEGKFYDDEIIATAKSNIEILRRRLVDDGSIS